MIDPSLHSKRTYLMIMELKQKRWVKKRLRYEPMIWYKADNTYEIRLSISILCSWTVYLREELLLLRLLLLFRLLLLRWTELLLLLG
jgi:hypothetical protein